MTRHLFPHAVLLLAAALSTSASAGQRFCVFDPAGVNGPQFNMTKDYALAARQWGAQIELKAYTDERLASEDFKAGQCDGVAITGIRGRQYNAFVGSLDSIGSVPSYRHLRQIITLLADARMQADMRVGDYENAGILPLGAGYVFVRDRSINSVEKAAGKKVAVMDYDKSQARLVQQLGAQPVASEIINFGAKFNNGQVDIIAAPAIAYGPLELYKGLGSQGAIYRFPLAQLTANVIIRHERFPEGFGEKSRRYFVGQLDTAERMIKKAEQAIPARYWLDLPAADMARYNQLLREARIQLARDGIYDKKMISLLKKLRCKLDAGAAECSESGE